MTGNGTHVERVLRADHLGVYGYAKQGADDEPATRQARARDQQRRLVDGVGEATGALDTMLNKIADFYDEEVDTAVDALTSLLEPILMVFLGVVVGGLVIAMYLPIFKLAGAIGG